MRIAILTSFLFHKTTEFDGEDRIIMGGAERFMLELCHMLQEDGHIVQVFQPLKPEFIVPGRTVTGADGKVENIPPQKHPTHIIQKDFYGIPVVCLPCEDKWDFSTAPGLNYTFNEMTVSFDLRIMFATFLCFPEVRLPAISISHGIFWDFPSNTMRQANPEQRQEFIRRQLYGFTAPNICVSVDTNVRGVVAAMSPGDENRIHVVPNFVDTKIFKPLSAEQKEQDRNRNSSGDSNRLRVLYPRRLSSVRGINDFLWLAAQFPEVDFLCCGNGGPEKDQEEHLQQMTEGKSNIKAIWRKPEEMSEIYQAADIVIVPTRAAEGTSLSCLEAMATGLPVITTPAGGLPNLIINNWNGLVVDLNHEKLADALKKLLKSKKMREKFGKRNRQMAVECFDIEIWKKRWREVIKKVVK